MGPSFHADWMQTVWELVFPVKPWTFLKKQIPATDKHTDPANKVDTLLHTVFLRFFVVIYNISVSRFDLQIQSLQLIL